MSKKKGEQVLQTEIDSSEQFQEAIAKEGLVVIDAYSEWCGHCKQIESTFKKLKMELSDPLLLFSIANADKISELENYRGRCEPCFLFYAGKELVAIVRGANAPVIIKTVTEQLAHEHKVISGEAQRKPIVDNFILQHQAKLAEEAIKEKEENTAPPPVNITICIIKPDMVADNKKDEIIEKIEAKGYKIVESKEITFTKEMVEEFYGHRKEVEPTEEKNEEQIAKEFEELITYMTSGVSCILALSKEGDVVQSWRSDIGSAILEEAKNDPDSFRAQYATDQMMNAIHGSDSHETATKELAYFFPQGIGASQKDSKRTIALIRPTALTKHKDQILEKIKASGFNIAMSKIVQLDKANAEDFYAEQKEKPFFDDLVNEMTSGPMMVLCLVKDDAVSSWRSSLGPKEKENLKDAEGTFRHEFDVAEVSVNSLHGATTAEQAEKELSKFFKMEQTVAFLKPGLAAEQKEEIMKKIEDSGFIIAAKKSEKLTEEIAKEMYKSSNNKEHFQDLVNLMTSGETEILVLSRENAIEGWRETIGDVDPTKAKETNPDSLRAVYGVDVLNNGFHGASTKDQAEHELNLFFPDSKFNEKGELLAN